MNTIRTPFRLEILMHYYCLAAPHPRADEECIQEEIKTFIESGLLQDGYMYNSGIYMNGKGRKYVEMILETPYPEFRWVDPRFEQLGI